MKAKYTALYGTSWKSSWVKWSKTISANSDSDARVRAKEYLKEIERTGTIGKGKTFHRLREGEKPILFKIIKTEEISLI